MEDKKACGEAWHAGYTDGYMDGYMDAQDSERAAILRYIGNWASTKYLVEDIRAGKHLKATKLEDKA